VEVLTEYKKAGEPDSEFKKVPLDPRVSNRVVCIGTEIGLEEQAKLLAFHEKNNDTFTWSTSNLVGVNKDIIEHKLQVNPRAKPRKQKLWKMCGQKVEAVRVEVQRLLDAGFIREVTYPEWLVNMVMVQKKNIKW
jgi:hypothetical protein